MSSSLLGNIVAKNSFGEKNAAGPWKIPDLIKDKFVSENVEGSGPFNDPKHLTSVRFHPVLKEAPQNVVSCNETFSLKNASQDNPVVVQSPNFPDDYPTEIW